MNNKIFTIIIGCNSSGLEGCINDAKKIYNLFYYLYQNYNKFQEPQLFTDDQTLNIEIIKNTINSIHKQNKNEEYTIIFFYAGHGSSGGQIRISNVSIDNNKLNEIITSGAVKPFNFILLLDSCHSGGMNIINSKYIKDILIITACTANQQSTESLTDTINDKFNKIEYNKIKNNNYHIGVFTYNFINIIENDLLKNKSINIDDIINDDIWILIQSIAKQNIYICGNKELFNNLFI